jgi:hypothetical protein
VINEFLYINEMTGGWEFPDCFRRVLVAGEPIVIRRL